MANLNNRLTTWRLLRLTLAASPAVFFAGVVLVTLADWLFHELTTLADESPWMAVSLCLAVSIALGFIYVRRKESRERRRTVDAMLRYWKWQVRSQGKPEPPSKELEYMQETIEGALSRWARDILSIRPGSEYPTTPFELVDRLAARYDRLFEKDRAGVTTARDFEEGI